MAASGSGSNYEAASVAVSSVLGVGLQHEISHAFL